MKKIKIIFFVFICILISCFIFFLKKQFFNPKKKSQEFNTEILANSSINIDKHHYDCEFSHSNKNTKIKIKSPKSIEGLCIEWNDGNQKISVEDLSKSFESFAFPENSFLNLVVKILDNISSIDLSEVKDDGRYKIFKGNIENNEFEICSEKSKILEIFVKSKDAKINFE